MCNGPRYHLFVNRRERSYHTNYVQRLRFEDYVAITLLQTEYSYRSNRGRMIQFDCVAVCYVNDELWVASNSHRINLWNVCQLASMMRRDGYYIDPNKIRIVENGRMNFKHAEMQLLYELERWFNDALSLQNIYMGVSKPCCRHCKQMLDEYNIGFTQYHHSRVVNWEHPFG